MAKKSSDNPTIDRNVSWMYFNHRILQEAQREAVPLLEKLAFLGIYSNNLDEFFRVRVSTLKRILEYREPRTQQLIASAAKSLRTINALNKEYAAEFENAFDRIKAELENERIFFVNEKQLSQSQAEYLKMVYRNDLNSSSYPLITSLGTRLDGLTDSSIYLAVKLTGPTGGNGKPRHDFALIELPTKEFGRFIVFPEENGRSCIMFLDDAVRFCLPLIFAGLHYEGYEAYTIKFTRDAEIELESGIGSGLLDKIAKGIRNRKKGDPVRFIYDKQMPRDLLAHLKRKLSIDRYDTCEAGARYHNMKDLMGFPSLGRSDLKFKPMPPVLLPRFDAFESTLEMIRRRDYLLHYPYHNFSNYIRLLREAAISREVKSIKTTVYRLAKDSKVVKALICAAKHGKQVTAVVELMARFDEASNISWSKKMQDAGINVLFGVEGLKIHCKLTHISSSKGDVACISTGNFHEGNARLYTDATLLTADKAIAREVNEVFAYIQQPYKPVQFKHLILSPQHMRKRLYGLINQEIRNARAGKDAYILGKINHISDKKLIGKLYEAAREGVKMSFLVRGNCSVVTTLPQTGNNIEIRGIIDRYLEHSRILIFCNGGRERYYIGSADWMTRNLDNRIEAYVPVYDPLIQEELKRIVDYGLRDNQAARIVDGSGENRIYTDGLPPFRSQTELYRHYAAESEESYSDPETLP